jgi:hypothetical protein
MISAWKKRAGLAIALAGLVAIWLWRPIQTADPAFQPRGGRPTVHERSPRVLVDEGHYNFHRAGGRYRPFADLLAQDGFLVRGAEGRITPEALRTADVFVTANPLGLTGLAQHAANLLGLERRLHLDVDAFAIDEIEALAAWVHAGGAALIVADHAPAGLAARRLAARFGVDMMLWWAEDERHHDPLSGSHGALVFSRENGLLADHPITNGRDSAEHVDQVMTFTGQALRAPEGVPLLRLSDSARHYPFRGSRKSEGRSASS